MSNPMNTELHGSSEHYLGVMVILNSECDHWFTIATWFFFNHVKGIGGGSSLWLHLKRPICLDW